jgi:hypothetical protein
MGFAFPDHQRVPALGCCLRQVSRIAYSIAVELRLPELFSCGRYMGELASFVLMPEAAMDEDDAPPTGEGNVRSTRCSFPLEAKSITALMQNLAHDLLWASVGTSYASHKCTALDGSQMIDQRATPVCT